MPGYAEKRSERQRQMEAVVPGSGFGVRMDRGAWAVGGTSPGTWSWPRAIAQGVASVGLLVVVGLLIDLNIGAYIGVSLAWIFLIARGYRIHRRYLAAQSPSVP
jgi:hypothetical protein